MKRLFRATLATAALSTGVVLLAPAAPAQADGRVFPIKVCITVQTLGLPRECIVLGPH
jgi:hypothetical protein